VRGVRHGVAPLRSESQPRLLDHARAAGAGDFYGIILAAGIDDQRLRSEAHGVEASSKLRTGVARNHHEAQFRQGQARLKIGQRVGRQGRRVSDATCDGGRGPFYVQRTGKSSADLPQSTHRRHRLPQSS